MSEGESQIESQNQEEGQGENQSLVNLLTTIQPLLQQLVNNQSGSQSQPMPENPVEKQTSTPVEENNPVEKPIMNLLGLNANSGVNMGARTKLRRVGKFSVNGGDEPCENLENLISDLDELPKCNGFTGHEDRCVRKNLKIVKQYQLINFDRNVLIDYIKKNSEDLKHGGVCYLLQFENTFLVEKQEDLEFVNEMRTKRGMNKNYGKPNFEHCPQDITYCNSDIHKSCICRTIFENRGHCAQCYQMWLEKIILIANFQPLHVLGTAKQQKQAKAMLRKSAFARQLQFIDWSTISNQFDYTPLNVSPVNLKKIAVSLGLPEHKYEYWFAQSDNAPKYTFEGMLEWLNFPCITEMIKMTYHNFTACLKEALRKVCQLVTGALSWMKGIIDDYFEKIISAFVTKIFGCISEYYERMKTEYLPKIIAIGVCLLLSLMGVLNWQSIYGMLCFGIKQTKNAMEGIVYLLASVMQVDAKVLMKYCANMILIAGALNACINMSGRVFAMFPSALRAALIERYGSSEQKVGLHADEWKARALTVLSLMKIPSVVKSDFYMQKLAEVQKEGFDLCKHVSSKRRIEMLNLFNRVNIAWGNLLQKEHAEKPRLIPFSVHLAGPPGVGKTTIVQKIINKLGFTTRDVYNRPPHTEFWDGFVSSDVIVYDEFLINSDLNVAMATEYLNLVSSGPYRPNLASTDNAAVGIKGTAATPKCVITINNSPHWCPPSLTSHDAFFRRRNLVVEMSLDTDFCKWKGIAATNNINLTKLTIPEIENMAWVNFRLLDPMTSTAYTSYIKYAKIIEFIQEQYDLHMEMNEILGTNSVCEGTPAQFYEEILKAQFNVPQGKFSVWNFIKGIFVNDFEAEVTRKSRVDRKSKTENEQHQPEEQVNLRCINTGGSNLINFLNQNQDVFQEPNTPSINVIESESNNNETDSDEQQESAEEPTLNLPDVPEEEQTVVPENITDEEIQRRLAMLATWEDRLPLSIQYAISKFNNHYQWTYSTISGYTIKILKNVKNFGIKAVKTIGDPSNFNWWIILWLIFCGYLMYCEEAAYEKQLSYYNTFEGETDSGRKQRDVKQRQRKITRLNKFEAHSSTEIVGTIMVQEEDVWTQLCVNVGERLVLTTCHLWEGIKRRSDVTLCFSGNTYETKVSPEDVVIDPENDLALFRVSCPSFPNTKDRSSKFISNSELGNIDTMQTTFEKPNERIYLTVRLTDGWSYSSAFAKHQPSKMFCYHAETVKGDCGAIVRSADKIAPSKIIGIHVCGNKNKSKPMGGAVAVTCEDIKALKDALCIVPTDEDVKMEAQSWCPFSPKEKPIEFPVSNILKTTSLPASEIMFFPTRTKLQPSLLNGNLPVQSMKQPSIMAEGDSRTRNSPSQSFIERISKVNDSVIDSSRLESCKRTMLKNWRRNVDKTYALRDLTIEEAILGLPGYLSSLNLKTSPGYPVSKMINSMGKTGCFKIKPGGEVEIEPWFRTAVQQRLDEMKRGVTPNNRFVVYWKDELVSPSKIEEARTRAIYCNDVISLVAFRIKFGILLARINNSSNATPSAIGMNQYSTDMDNIYSYLTSTGNRRFVAGDYKNYDFCYHVQFQRAAYEIFFELSEQDENNCEYLWKHEAVNPKLQFKSELIETYCMHTSGCFLTSVINCFVNELYFRYAFASAFPTKSFDKECRLKVLGDDHILSVSDRVDFNPLVIKAQMRNIGQEYTSDIKDKELTSDFRTFEDVTFLGAHPRLIQVDGMMTYVGAPKQQQLWQTVQWTKTNNVDLNTVVEACIYLSALWDENFHIAYKNSILLAFNAINVVHPIEYPSYLEMQSIAAHRNANSTEDWFRAQSRVGLTQVIDSKIEEQDGTTTNSMVFGNSGLTEAPGTLDLGTDSLIHRADVQWTLNDEAKKSLLRMELPFGALDKGQQQNLQNMPFERYLYLRHDVEVTIQIAGTPFHQGTIVAVLVPAKLMDAAQPNVGGYRYSTDAFAYTFYNHVLMSPNTSTTATLKLPFVWFRDWIISTKKENFATLDICVLSPLNTGKDGASEVTVSVFTKFPNLKCRVPRPYATSGTRLAGDLLTRPVPDMEPSPQPDEFEAQGNRISTNNTYQLSNIVGDVPLNTSNKQSATASVEANPNVSALPLDNPPVCSGSLPVYDVFPSRSKTVGISTSVALAHHPEEMHRQAHKVEGMNADMSVEAYCNRPTVLGFFTWTPQDNVGDVKMSIPLNSILSWSNPEAVKGIWTPSCCFPLNCAMFWRADFKFTFLCVMSDFHSGRLRASVAYGAEPFTKLQDTIYRNQIMDFTSGSEIVQIVVPFNAPTEYLISAFNMSKVKEGLDSYDLYNQEMGSIQITVANQLKCPQSVAQSVQVIVFASCENVKLREFRPYVPHRINIKATTVKKNDDPNNDEFEAQSNTTSQVQKQEERVDDFTTTTAVPVDDYQPIVVPKPCILKLGEKFEYTWNNFGEVFRRYTRVDVTFRHDTNETVFIPTLPGLWRDAFQYWAGHLQMRIYVKHTTPVEMSLNFSPSVGPVILETTNATIIESKNDTVSYKTYLVDANRYNPCENLYPIANAYQYIDVNIPFNTILNFLPVSNSLFDGLQNLPFSVTLRCEKPLQKYLEVYLKMGDDCRLFIPRPIVTYKPFDDKMTIVSTTPRGGFQFQR